MTRRVARPLDDYRVGNDLGTIRTRTVRRIDRSAAMAFGAAIASLAVAAVVVNQSAAAIDPKGSIAGASLEVGTVVLADDDGGRSLIRLDSMLPGRPAEECIEITYEGTILPVELTLAVAVTGDLARLIMVEIDRASAGGFGRCDDLVAPDRVYQGSLADLASGGPLPVDVYRNQSDSTSFRFRFELLDEAEAMGLAVNVDFRWEAVPL